MRFHDAIADYIPEFAKLEQGTSNLAQVMSTPGAAFLNANLTLRSGKITTSSARRSVTHPGMGAGAGHVSQRGCPLGTGVS